MGETLFSPEFPRVFSQYVSWICISQCLDFSWPRRIVLCTVEYMAERPVNFEYNNIYSFRLREGMILPSIPA